jgi:hypothetical protein
MAADGRAKGSDKPARRRSLRYVARAGLLPELSRQTYDSLDKALREAILNSVDARARDVVLDLRHVRDRGIMVLRDDGVGMSLSEIEHAFLSLGGSEKYRDATRFGRIGIGSLAILHYGQTAEIRTKKAGALTVTTAALDHPWELDKDARMVDLADFIAGEAYEAEYDGDRSDQFTEITLKDLDPSARRQLSDSSALYEIMDRLARILPLPFPHCTVADALREVDPEGFEEIAAHAREFGCGVTVITPLEEVRLERRVYGSRESDDRERWIGAPTVFCRTVSYEELGRRRSFCVVGYLLSQERANPAWTGLTVRVQNVAVEEQSFFDLESDPGFRRYISGEVFLVGDVPREDLISLDRTALVRESPAFPQVARVVRASLQQFKTERVQRPRRDKVVVKRVLDAHIAAQDAVLRVCVAADLWGRTLGVTGLPGSGVYRRSGGVADRTIETDLNEAGVEVRFMPGSEGASYRLEYRSGLSGFSLWISDARLAPKVGVLGRSLRVRFRSESGWAEPVLIRARGGEIVVNLAHSAVRGLERASAIEVVCALEFARLMEDDDHDLDFDQRVLRLLS